MLNNAGGTFANVDISSIQLTVQYATLGVCGGRSFSGTQPASVTVIKIGTGLTFGTNADVDFSIKKFSTFDTAVAQCAESNGKVYAEFNVLNKGVNPLLLTAVLEDGRSCNLGEHVTSHLAQTTAGFCTKPTPLLACHSAIICDLPISLPLYTWHTWHLCGGQLE